VIDKLSDKDLLALALGTRASDRLLEGVGDIEAIGRAPHLELKQAVGGVGARKTAAIFELGRRAMTCRTLGVVSTPQSVFDRLQGFFAGLKQEVFVVLALNARNQVIAEIEVARGTLNGVEAHPREIFRPLIRISAAGCIIAHNHPTGDPTPSQEDMALTRRVQAVGELVGIPMVDHIVIAGRKFRSVSEMLGGFD